MFLTIYNHELTRHLRGIPFYLFSLLLFITAFAFLSSSNADMQFLGMSLGAKQHNAPIVVAQLMARLSIFASLFTVVIVGQAVARDFEHKVHDAFFTLPLSKGQYLGGRFFGALSAMLLSFLVLIPGIIVGCLSQAGGQYGPFEFASFFIPLTLIVLPNMLFTGALFFAVATLTRRIMPAYLSAIGLILLYVTVSISLAFLAPENIRAMADPFAIVTLDVLTQFWTVNDINQQQLPVWGALLLNRVIWLTVTVLIGIYTYQCFAFVSSVDGGKEIQRSAEPQPDKTQQGKSIQQLAELGPIETGNRLSNHLQQLWHMAGRESGLICRHPIFMVLGALALFDILTNFIGQTGIDGDNLLPLTINYLKYTNMAWGYMLPLTIFFSASLMWKPAETGIKQLLDALPVPRWVKLGSVLLTIMIVQSLIVSAMLIAGVLCQWLKFDHTNVELALYFKTLFGLQLPGYWLMAVMVVFIQTLVPGKNTGIFVSLLFFIGSSVLFDVLNWSQPLLNYGNLPDYVYSVFGGHQRYADLLGWYLVYWLLAGVLLVTISEILLVEGDELSLIKRLRTAAQTVNRTRVVLLTTCLTLFVLTGSWISYNRYQLNDHLSAQQLVVMQANYEKNYAHLASKPQLSMTHMDVNLDLYPSEKRVLLKARYQLKNNSGQPVEQILIHFWRRYISQIHSLELSQPAKLVQQGDEFGIHQYRLTQALQPGEQMNVNFELSARSVGFTDDIKDQSWITKDNILLGHRSGNPSLFPTVGYSHAIQLTAPHLRKQHGLSEVPPLPDFAHADRKKMLLPSDVITMNSVVSTSKAHTVVASGQLVEQWQAQDRHFFKFELTPAAVNEIIFVSGPYHKATKQVNDVELAVYYHPQHPWNVQRMLDSAAQAIAYGNANLSPYPYPSLSIVEIPDYPFHGIAPTLFPWREGSGFTAQPGEPQCSDKVSNAIGDVVAHQWWGFQAVPQFAQGGMSISGLSKYLSLMINEQTFGSQCTLAQRKKLRQQYLKYRQQELHQEQPLTQTRLEQDYLNRAKTALAFYAMQYYIGETPINQAFRQVINQYNIQTHQYFNLDDLLSEIKAIAPPGYQLMISDWFERITLHDVSIQSANAEPMAQNRYRVQFNLSSDKTYTNDDGTAVSQPLDEYIALSITDKQGKTLVTRKIHVTQQQQRVDIVVQGQPSLIQIDPELILLETNIDNNRHQF